MSNQKNGKVAPTEVIGPEDVRKAANRGELAELEQDVEQEAALASPPPDDRPVLDHRLLTMRDLKRARAGPLEGRDPFEVLGEPMESTVLMIWCFESRTDPGFTWEQALDTPIGSYRPADHDAPPPIPTATKPGSSAPSGAVGSSKPKRRSATSTGSPSPTTTP